MVGSFPFVGVLQLQEQFLRRAIIGRDFERGEDMVLGLVLLARGEVGARGVTYLIYTCMSFGLFMAFGSCTYAIAVTGKWEIVGFAQTNSGDTHGYLATPVNGNSASESMLLVRSNR